MKFVCFEMLKPFVTHDPKKGIQVHERLIAGATAGAVAQSIVYPLETMKTRLATTPGIYTESIRWMCAHRDCFLNPQLRRS